MLSQAVDIGDPGLNQRNDSAGCKRASWKESEVKDDDDSYDAPVQAVTTEL